MARGVSKFLSATLPKRYSRQWLERMDKRTRLWRAITDRITELESDAGGAEMLSHAKRSVMRRAVFLELLAESEGAALLCRRAVGRGPLHAGLQFDARCLSVARP